MPEISPELRSLDEDLLKAEDKEAREIDKFLALILSYLLFKTALLPSFGREDLQGLGIPRNLQSSLQQSYLKYFTKIEDIATAYTKQELMGIARTKGQQRKIQRLKPKQKSYNRAYATELMKKQIGDLESDIGTALNELRKVQPLSPTAVNNTLRSVVKKYKDMRSGATAETEANRITNQTRLALFEKSGLVKGVRFTAVLDKRTTVICRSRNGKTLSLKNPMLRNYTPPLHVRCRSYLVPVDMQNDMPFTPITELREINRSAPARPITKVIKVK